MRRTLLLVGLVISIAPTLSAQVAPRAAARPATLTIQVTDSLGMPVADAQVTTTGPVARQGVTGADGSLRLANMRAGNYRLRFTREGSIALERDLTIRPGESPTIEVSLSPAPEMPKAPEPVPVAPPPVVKTLPPPGEPKLTPVPLFLEKNFIGGREARKESSIGCAATGTATLHQLREAWLGHAHEEADEWIYVVAGEGTLRVGTSEQRVQAGTFSLIPHATAHALLPQGRNPLILISVLSGPRCQG